MFEMIFGFMPFGILAVATGMEMWGPTAAILAMSMVLLVATSIMAVKFIKLRNLG